MSTMKKGHKFSLSRGGESSLYLLVAAIPDLDIDGK